MRSVRSSWTRQDAEIVLSRQLAMLFNGLEFDGNVHAAYLFQSPIIKTRLGPKVQPSVWLFASPALSVAAPGRASDRAPVAAQLLTVTDHPGLDLALVFVRKGGRAGGSHSGSGPVIE